eukprot:scaffold998_cov213-Chaetoceros_neogracile.AAC.7
MDIRRDGKGTLRWCAFLCGFVSKPLIDIQHDHYLELQLKKEAERWAIKLIHKSWNIMYQLWTQRNTALHEIDAIHENSGVALTDVFLCGKLQRIEYSYPEKMRHNHCKKKKGVCYTSTIN